jgi:putative MATE family efflux protein
MAKIKNVDMLNGNLLGAILRFAVPIFLIGLIQNLFNSVDMVVLGQMANTEAVASVGATGVILGLLVNVFLAISQGAKVVLARYLGANEEERVKKAVSTSMITGLLLGILSTVIGMALAKPFLILTDCPADCMEGALLYMRIYIAAAPAIMLYNFGTSVLTVSGDSQRPLYYMIAAGLLNVVLNFVLCLILPQKVVAVAVATVAAQVLGAILVLRRLSRVQGSCHFTFRRLSWSKSSFGRLMSNGLPMALNSALYPIANLQIQSATNSFGAAVIAGNAASASVEGLVGSACGSPFGAAATTFVGQNLGAGKKDRVKKSILYCMTLGVGIAALLGALCYLFSAPLASLYVGDDAAAIAAAQIRMRYVLLPYFICCAFGLVNHVIQSFGYASFTAAVNVICVVLFRVFWMAVIYPLDPGFDMICLCYLVSWCLTLLTCGGFLLYLYFGKFKKGTLKKM